MGYERLAYGGEWVPARPSYVKPGYELRLSQ